MVVYNIVVYYIVLVYNKTLNIRLIWTYAFSTYLHHCMYSFVWLSTNQQRVLKAVGPLRKADSSDSLNSLGSSWRHIYHWDDMLYTVRNENTAGHWRLGHNRIFVLCDFVKIKTVNIEKNFQIIIIINHNTV